MSRSASDVSVITVNWNGQSHLRHLLPSLAALHCHEILVVDNGSTDGSIEFLRDRYPGVRVLRNSRNMGFAHPCNQGAHAASGNVLAFINNDARADKSWLTAALPLLSDQQPCVASRILDWAGEKIDYNGSSLQYLGYAEQKDTGLPTERAPSNRSKVLFPCGGAMLIDRDYYLEIGGFDATFFAIYEDVDLGWRIWLRGEEVGYAPDSIVFHRGHATFDSQEQHRTRYLMHRNALLTILKNYDEETVQRVFPAALLMAVRRAVLFSGVERESFYLWERTATGLDRHDPLIENRVLDAINQLAAVDDVIRDLPDILVRRRRVQEQRKRSDREILALFEDPFRSIVEDPEYQNSEIEILRCLGLDRIFSREFPPIPAEFEDDLQRRLQILKQELSRQQYWGQRAWDHAPPDSESCAPNPREFFRIWKKEGFTIAWQRFVEFVHRGL